jgi:hypothetical protein
MHQTSADAKPYGAPFSWTCAGPLSGSDRNGVARRLTAAWAGRGRRRRSRSSRRGSSCQAASAPHRASCLPSACTSAHRTHSRRDTAAPVASISVAAGCMRWPAAARRWSAPAATAAGAAWSRISMPRQCARRPAGASFALPVSARASRPCVSVWRAQAQAPTRISPTTALSCQP